MNDAPAPRVTNSVTTNKADTFITTHTEVNHVVPLLEECPICLDNYSTEPCLRITGIKGCNHNVGSACLQQMLRSQPNEEKKCPLCRTVWISALGINATQNRNHGRQRALDLTSILLGSDSEDEDEDEELRRGVRRIRQRQVSHQPSSSVVLARRRTGGDAQDISAVSGPVTSYNRDVMCRALQRELFHQRDDSASHPIRAAIFNRDHGQLRHSLSSPIQQPSQEPSFVSMALSDTPPPPAVRPAAPGLMEATDRPQVPVQSNWEARRSRQLKRLEQHETDIKNRKRRQDERETLLDNREIRLREREERLINVRHLIEAHQGELMELLQRQTEALERVMR